MNTDPLSATFSALADPTRRAILARLAGGEATVTELAAPFAMTLPAVTKHLKVLERAGLIVRGRAAQWRPCRLEAKPLQEAAGWVEQYRRFWEQRLDRLEDYRREVTRRIEVIKATPRQAGVTEIRIPGERGYKTRARLMRDGIEIDRKIYDALRRLSDGNLNHGG